LPPPADTAASYRRRLDRLRACITRVERNCARGSLLVSDCELVYESTYLAGIGLLEATLAELFTEFIWTGRGTRPGSFALMRPRTRDNLQKIVRRDRPYVAYLPYKDCLDMAKLFLNDGKPFSLVTDAEKKILADAILVRNAIAHKSSFALAKFRSQVPGVDSLPRNRRLPGAYLRRTYRAYPNETWYDLYLQTFDGISQTVASSW
jgi:hypothetical protein